MRLHGLAIPGALLLLPLALGAQGLALTIENTGLAIGDRPRVNGVRINFRDRRLEVVRGVNVTVWSPVRPATGTVTGLALGLPVTGARSIHGLALGVFGAGADASLHGIAIAGLGIGAGGDLAGLSVAGVGVGAGGTIRGIQLGGIGVGSGGNLTGISVGGIGVGAGRNLTGVAIGGLGVGGGRSLTGIAIGGIGVGSGGRLTGLAVGGVGVGAPEIRGVVIGGLAAGGAAVRGLVVSGAYFTVTDGGRVDGASVSAVNNIKGAQHGLAIGLWNYARELHGAQVGIINISRNGGRRRILPLVSVR